MELSKASIELTQSVFHLANTTVLLSDADLSQPYRWGSHQEGVRFAILGAMHELRTLAVHIASERRVASLPLTRAQHALAQYHASFRDLDAILLGLSTDDIDKVPMVGEWSVRDTLAHIIAAQRNFFALVHYGLRRQREGGRLPVIFPHEETERLLGSHDELSSLLASDTLAGLREYHAQLNQRCLTEFASISDEEVDGPSMWWEREPFSLEYRIHRMEAHLRQHTAQIEYLLDRLNLHVSESRRLLRQLLAALAEVEGLLIGASAVAESDILAIASSIHRQADGALDAVTRANALLSAITGGDREHVRSLIEQDPQLANALSRDGVPAVRLASYYGQKEIADILIGTPGINIEIWDGAALGRLEAVEEAIQWAGDGVLNAYSRDGYSPLQLACFFGHEEVANYLINNGADVHATSQNPMAIQPIHAATAGNHIGIVHLLLAAGADPNAVQQDSFRPLHSAAQNGNAAIVQLLLEYGADMALPDAKGQLPRDLADESGDAEAIALLSGRS